MNKSILEKNKYQFTEKVSLRPVKEDDQSLVTEIDHYLQDLKDYKVSLMELSKNVPNKENRNLYLNLALILNQNQQIMEDFRLQKKLPLRKISHLVEVPLFKLEEGEQYLSAYTLLLGENYPLLKNTLTYGPRVKEHLTEVLKFMPQGMVLKCGGGQCFLLTRHGEFYRVKNEGHQVGTVALGTKKRNPLNWKKPGAFLLIIALIGFTFYQIQSGQIERTIILRVGGEVKMEFNSFGQLIQATGTNNDGDQFVALAEFDQKDMDTVLAEIIEQAYITRTAKERDEVLIIISGKPLEEDFFKSGKTHDRILSYQFNPKINNDGSFLDVE